jgi:phenylacetate-CoA ligase
VRKPHSDVLKGQVHTDRDAHRRHDDAMRGAGARALFLLFCLPFPMILAMNARVQDNMGTGPKRDPLPVASARSPYTAAVESGYALLPAFTPYKAWAHFQELQKNQWLSPDELCALRWARLQAILRHAVEHIPFYRQRWQEHGVDPRRFTSEKDLVDLPVVTKELLSDAQQDDLFLLSKRRDYQFAHTSGTTGQRFQVPFTLAGFQKKYAGHLRQMYASGWRLGMKSATIHYAGHSQFRGAFSGRAEDAEPFARVRDTALRVAHRRRVLTPYHRPETGDDAQVKAWYEQLREYRPYLLETMDYNLPLLKDYIERSGLPRLSIPKTFVLGTHSAGLLARLEEFFSTEIYDRYSPHEIEGVAYACSVRRGMHMAIDCYHTEFLDDRDRPVLPEETGAIVVTDLDNDLMPLIRYKLGDVGHALAEPCSCGRGFPLMAQIDGRVRDILDLKSGKQVAPARIAGVLQDEPAVSLFQVVQYLDGTIVAHVVPGGSGLPAGVAERIVARLTGLLGAGERIAVAPARHIRLEPNGKCSFVKKAETPRFADASHTGSGA